MFHCAGSEVTLGSQDRHVLAGPHHVPEDAGGRRRVRLYHDPEAHTPTHLMAVGPTARAAPPTIGTSFDVYEAIARPSR